MEALCKEIRKKVQSLKNDLLEVKYTYDTYEKKEYVNVYIEDQKGYDWCFCIEKNIREKKFEISFSTYTNRKTIDENKRVILFYYEAIMNAIEYWVGTQRDIRFQYMLDRDAVVDESVTICYLKSLKKDLA